MKAIIRVPTKLQRKLMNAQRWKCFWCDEPMTFLPGKGNEDARGVTREHIFPHATTGKGLVYNIVLAHAPCNTARGDRQPTPYEIAKAAAIYREMGITPFVAADSPEGQEIQLRFRKMRA